MRTPRPTPAQRRYLERGLDQPGGKLPLFDGYGQQIKPSTIQSCLGHGWAKPWFANPVKPDWLVCKLTDRGRAALSAGKAGPKPVSRAAREPEAVAEPA